MTTTTPPVRGRQLPTRTIVTFGAVLALAIAIVLTLWLLITPAPSHPSTFAPSVGPAAGSAQVCAPSPGVRFC